MNMHLSYLILIFFVYSFIGYVCEIISSSIVQKKLVNRGFLCGPYCPIYGVGSLFILLLLLRFKEDPVLIFVLGALITTCIEYFTSFVLEKIFHNKWWDYSYMKLHIHGRVCLQNTLLFGFGTLVIIYMAQPFIHEFLMKLNPNVMRIVAYSLLFIFIIDFIYSVIIAYNLRNRIIICEELKNEKLAKIPGMLEKILKERVEQFKTYPRRLLDAFPYLKDANAKEFDLMKMFRDKSKGKNDKKKKKKK